MTVENGNLKLYSYRRCPFAIRVRLVLFEKKLEFQVVEEDLKNKSEELKRLHPEARVPLLVHNDFIIFESSVITEYVNETFEGINLMPDDPKKRAEVRMWTTWCNHIFKPEVDRFKYGESPENRKSAEEKLRIHLGKLETQLSQSNYLIGDSFTLADIHVFPFFRQLERIKPELHAINKFEKTWSWFNRICDRPSFEQTMRK